MPELPKTAKDDVKRILETYRVFGAPAEMDRVEASATAFLDKALQFVHEKKVVGEVDVASPKRYDAALRMLNAAVARAADVDDEVDMARPKAVDVAAKMEGFKVDDFQIYGTNGIGEGSPAKALLTQRPNQSGRRVTKSPRSR